MLTPEQAAPLAEEAVLIFVRECQANSVQDVRNALELLTSTAIMAHVKYSGREVTAGMINRCEFNMKCKTDDKLASPFNFGGEH